ncbi:MAG: AIR synthase related protein [Spirochaetia bacterium]|nr:AIR synthase related protein [Spirochaetia bacterium]
MGLNPVEKNLIELIKERSKTPDGIPGLGIGDDAAFLLLSSMEESKLIVSTDSVVENVHYKINWCSYCDVAVKLVERSSSDLLAKGGHPHWALLNMNISEKFSKDTVAFTQFVDAFCEKLKEHKITLIGGDITRSATNTFTMTVLGNTSTFVRRKNDEVEAGDAVVLWGRVGGSSYALDEFLNSHNPSDDTASFYRRPLACWKNNWLTELHVRASMDQSDSVMETLDTLANENSIHLKIQLDLIPLSMKVPFINKNEIVKNILKAAEDLAVFAIVPSHEIKNINRFSEICIIGEVLEKIDPQQKSGRISYFWKNDTIEVDEIEKDLYRHF